MKLPKSIKVNVCDAIKKSDHTITVRLCGVKRLRVRLWISLRLIRLGMWLIYGHVEFEGGELPEIDLTGGPASESDHSGPIQDESGYDTGQVD